LIKTGLNIAPHTNTTLRFDVPGDSVVVNAYDPGDLGVDMVFRILPGPGNYEPIGHPESGDLRAVPSGSATERVRAGVPWDTAHDPPMAEGWVIDVAPDVP
jgi:hypothetical protein